MPDPLVLAIPARYDSTRLPGKPLQILAGKPLIHHVIERARQLESAEVVVATDDSRVAQIAAEMGASVVMTRSDHATGSDRLAEAAEICGWTARTRVINLQGDEPLMPLSCLEAVIEALDSDPDASVATLATPILTIEEAFDPSCVKVVLCNSQRALYFSRAPIPWFRNEWAQVEKSLPLQSMFRHIGLYAYRAGALRSFARLAQTPLEQAECLEQLRLLEHGFRIVVRMAPERIPPGVDTPADLLRVEALMRSSEN
mgnify:CR=1 FL=1